MNKILLSCLFFVCCHDVFAQSYTVSGFVKENESLESLPSAVIRVKENNTIAVTNNYGFYAIQLPTGAFTLYVSYTGMGTDTVSVNVTQNIRKDFLLAPQKMQEVVVTGGKEKSNVKRTQMGTHTIKAAHIQDVPSLLGEKDVIKTLQLMPGVQRGSEGSTGLYVRGGNSDQNLIILDDAVVYNANHLFGFFSLFNGNAVKGVEFIKGGFPARYGERLSSVINLTMKDGNKESYHGEVGVGLLSSRLMVEGPIQKGKSSFILSGRRTYADLLAQPFMDKDKKIGYYFYDFTAKANAEINSKNKIYISGYFGKDNFFAREDEMNNPMKYNFFWGNATTTLRWNHVVSPKIFANLSLIFSQYALHSKMEQQYDTSFFSSKYYSNITDVGVKYDWEFYTGKKHLFRGGLKATSHVFKPNVVTLKGSDANFDVSEIEQYNCPEFNVYAEDEWSATKALAFNMGVRGSMFKTQTKTYANVEPRFSGRFLLNDNTSVKMGYAVMNQYIHLLSSTGLGLPTDLWVPSTDRLRPQRSEQYSIGLAKVLPQKDITISIEGYYKKMKDVVSYKDGATFLTARDKTFRGEKVPFHENVMIGLGKSYGGELMLEKKEGRLSGWLAYTLSWTKNSFKEVKDGAWFYPAYDRRHNLSVVGFYYLKPNVRLNALFTLATGNPIRFPIHSVKVPQIPLSGDLSNSGKSYSYTENYTERGLFRAETYHRMDVGIQFIKQKKWGERVWEISVYNVYNRQNPFFYAAQYPDDYNFSNPPSRGGYKIYKYTVFPIIPSITYSYKF